MQIVRPVVKTVGGLGSRVRDLGRLQEVARVLARHGLGMLVAGIDLPGFVPAVAADEAGRFDTTPQRLVAALQELGPTMVKLGQVMSTRPDVLPAEYIEALESLQDEAAPLPFEVVAEVLDKELGADWQARVGLLDPKPLATASIAQVHRAILPDGREVVFKVQRPGIKPKIEADLSILIFLARRALVEYPEAKAFDPLGVLDEFERSIRSELDFVQEAEHTRRFRKIFAPKRDIVRIPAVVEELSTRRVLVLEYLEGVKMRLARDTGCDMEKVGQRYLEVAYDMLFEHGVFHGDLHPGNVVVMEDEVLGLLDFGMVGRLTEEMRDQVIQIIFALQRGDYRSIARLFYDIAIKEERVDYRAVERETVQLMEKYWSGDSVRDMRLGPYVVDLSARAARHGARIPSGYTMFFKAIVTSEGLSRTLIPEVDPIRAAEPYIQRFLRRQLSEEHLQGEVLYTALTLSSLARRLPGSMSQLLDDIEHQRLTVLTRDPEAGLERAAADRRTNRTILAAMSIGASACGTVALFADPFHPWGVPVISLLFLGLGLSLGAMALLMVLRNLGAERR